MLCEHATRYIAVCHGHTASACRQSSSASSERTTRCCIRIYQGQLRCTAQDQRDERHGVEAKDATAKTDLKFCTFVSLIPLSFEACSLCHGASGRGVSKKSLSERDSHCLVNGGLEQGQLSHLCKGRPAVTHVGLPIPPPSPPPTRYCPRSSMPLLRRFRD